MRMRGLGAAFDLQVWSRAFGRREISPPCRMLFSGRSSWRLTRVRTVIPATHVQCFGSLRSRAGLRRRFRDGVRWGGGKKYRWQNGRGSSRRAILHIARSPKTNETVETV
jgi:hypothetical protein